MNLSPAWVNTLMAAGYETKHWSDIGSANALDTEIMSWARDNGFIVFTHDLDFSALLFSTNATSPSVIQIRSEDIRPKIIGNLVKTALKESAIALKQGALVTIDPRKNRIRLLPLKQEKQ